VKIMTASSRVYAARILAAFLLFAPLVALLSTAATATASPLLLRAAEPAPGARMAAAGAFTAALSADVQGLDPALLTDGNSLLVTSQIYDTLIAYEPGGSKPVPALAASWSASAGGKTWTFNLRSGLTFHDGTPLNAEAVAFNFQRWWDPANPQHVGNFEAFKSAFGGFKGDGNCTLAAVSAAGPLEFQLTLTQPDSALPTRLAAEGLAIASPAAIQAGTLNSSPTGTGPYRFAERVPGDHIALEANTAYWGGAPHLDLLTFQIIPDAGQRLAALASGAVQTADGFTDNELIVAGANSVLRILWRPGTSLGYLGINRAHGPLGDLLVRKAIAHAVNLPGLISSHYNIRSQAAGQFLPPHVWGYDPNLDGYTYDPALARSLLAQAGYSGGFTTTLAYRDTVRSYLPDPLGTANAIAADLQAVGIDADVVWYGAVDMSVKAANGDLDLFLLGWYAGYAHPANFFGPHFCDPAFKGFGPLDTDLCSQLALAANTFDIAAQVPMYTGASDRVYDTLPALALANQRTALVTRFDVAGLVPSPMSAENYEVVRFAQAQGDVTPEAETTISYTDAGGQATTATVPAGAVTEPVTLRLAEMPAPAAPVGLGYGGQAFEMTAFQEGSPQLGFAFDKPVVVTVDYADADIARLQENSLALYLKTGETWSNAAETCSPPLPYAIDAIANRISVSVCHLTIFALFGEKKPLTYLPIVMR
jgi:peptide/nickel transport system substrate-binding protein